MEENEVAWGDYMRVSVCLDVTKPLPRGKKVNVGTVQPSWPIWFSYECLPNFCYFCGRLGHGMKECERGGRSITEAAINELPYGQWLRASPERRKEWRTNIYQNPGSSPQMAERKRGQEAEVTSDQTTGRTVEGAEHTNTCTKKDEHPSCARKSSKMCTKTNLIGDRVERF